jgi:DNA-binding NarL/FixJ family response regulator
MGTTFAVIDDHRLVRDGLAEICARGDNHQVIYQGDSVSEVLALMPAPDIVLLDLLLHGTEVGPEVVRALIGAGSKVLVVSATTQGAIVRQLLKSGVSGFVSKVDSTESLSLAIAEVVGGGTWTTSELAAFIARDPEPPAFSAQEARALELYASGLKMESVARRMGVANTTAREYISRVRAKYAATGRPAPTKLDLHQNAVQDGILRLNP